jgi:hypothetical protein
LAPSFLGKRFFKVFHGSINSAFLQDRGGSARKGRLQVAGTGLNELNGVIEP